MKTGKLFVAATPIGNAEDFTLRVVRLLKECDLLVVETHDALSRVFGEAGIEYNPNSIEFNGIGKAAEHDKARDLASSKVLDYLNSGKTVLSISDEGMPGINDPGQKLMNLANRNGHEVSVIPGPSIVTTAFVHAIGLDQSYSGYGFTYWQHVMSRADAVKKATAAANSEDAIVTTIMQQHFVDQGIFEAMLEILGDRSIALCFNMTKKDERIVSTKLSLAKHALPLDERQQCSIVIYPF